MTIDLDAWEESQLIRAGNMIGRRWLVVGLERSGLPVDAIETQIDELTSRLATLSPENLAALSALTAANLRRLLAYEPSDVELKSAQLKSLDFVPNAPEAAGFGAEMSMIVISIGFSITMLLVASQLSVKGKVGPFQIEKRTEFPKEIVQVVDSVANAASAALVKSAQTPSKHKAGDNS